MSEQENVEVVKQGYAAFGSGDMEKLLSLFAEDIEWTIPSIEGAPFGGPLRGRDQVAAFFESLAGAEDIQELRVSVPHSESFSYATTLRSMTQGRASHTMEFKYYEAVPKNYVKDLVLGR